MGSEEVASKEGYESSRKILKLKQMILRLPKRNNASALYEQLKY